MKRLWGKFWPRSLITVLGTALFMGAFLKGLMSVLAGVNGRHVPWRGLAFETGVIIGIGAVVAGMIFPLWGLIEIYNRRTATIVPRGLVFSAIALLYGGFVVFSILIGVIGRFYPSILVQGAAAFLLPWFGGFVLAIVVTWPLIKRWRVKEAAKRPHDVF